MINIVVASKIWSSHWSKKKVQIFCDNMAMVQVLTTGKASDSMLVTCAPNIWLIATMFNIDFPMANHQKPTAHIRKNYSRLYLDPHPPYIYISEYSTHLFVCFQISRARRLHWPPLPLPEFCMVLDLLP